MVFQTMGPSVDVPIRNWGMVALRGVAALVFGLLTFLNPVASLAALVFLFGAFARVDGIFTVVSAVANRRGEPQWVALLVSGILRAAIGVLTFLMRRITSVVLLYFVAA